MSILSICHEVHPLTAHVNLSPGATFVLGLIAFGPALVAFVLLVVGLLKKGRGKLCKNWLVAAAVSVGIQVIWLLILSNRF